MQSSWRSIGEFAWLFEVRDGFYHGTKQSREGWRWKYQIPQKEQVSDPTTFGLSGYLLFSLQNVGDHESWSSNFFEDSFWVQLKKNKIHWFDAFSKTTRIHSQSSTFWDVSCAIGPGRVKSKSGTLWGTPRCTGSCISWFYWMPEKMRLKKIL